MSDNIEDRCKDRLILTPAEAATEAAESLDSRQRREFLRRVSIAAFAIPTVGGITDAADKKKAEKDKKAHPSGGKSAKSDARSGSGSKSKSLSKPSGGSASSPATGGGDSPHSTSSHSPSSGSPDAGTSAQPLPALYPRENLAAFEQILTDEIAHVEFLLNALGSSARPMPTYQGLEADSVQQFATMARAFENVGAGAYLGAMTVLSQMPGGLQYVIPSASIGLIEARHAGYLNALLNLNIVENVEGNVSTFEQPLTPEQIVPLASPHIASLNGGPPLIPVGGFTQPFEVLNFALVLEYLERTFYAMNLPGLVNILAKGAP